MSSIIPSRRSFLLGLGAVLAAPAVVRAGSLMPVRTPIVMRPGLFKVGEYKLIASLDMQSDFSIIYGHFNIKPEWIEHFYKIVTAEDVR